VPPIQVPPPTSIALPVPTPVQAPVNTVVGAVTNTFCTVTGLLGLPIQIPCATAPKHP
jgi:hypothetical protein